MHRRVTRRSILAGAAAAFVGSRCLHAEDAKRPATQAATEPALPPWDGPIIDIHQHTNYRKRGNEALLHHQKKMGVTQTVLLPAGTSVDTPSTLKGIANGLYAGAGGNDTVAALAEAH